MKAIMNISKCIALALALAAASACTSQHEPPGDQLTAPLQLTAHNLSIATTTQVQSRADMDIFGGAITLADAAGNSAMYTIVQGGAVSSSQPLNVLRTAGEVRLSAYGEVMAGGFVYHVAVPATSYKLTWNGIEATMKLDDNQVIELKHVTTFITVNVKATGNTLLDPGTFTISTGQPLYMPGTGWDLTDITNPTLKLDVPQDFNGNGACHLILPCKLNPALPLCTLTGLPGSPRGGKTFTVPLPVKKGTTEQLTELEAGMHYIVTVTLSDMGEVTGVPTFTIDAFNDVDDPIEVPTLSASTSSTSFTSFNSFNSL